MAEGVEDLPITDRLVSWFKDRIHLEWSDCRITRVYKSTGYVDKKPFIVIQHCGSPLGRCGYLVKDEDDMKAVESLCRQPPAAPEGPMSASNRFARIGGRWFLRREGWEDSPLNEWDSAALESYIAGGDQELSMQDAAAAFAYHRKQCPVPEGPGEFVPLYRQFESELVPKERAEIEKRKLFARWLEGRGFKCEVCNEDLSDWLHDWKEQLMHPDGTTNILCYRCESRAINVYQRSLPGRSQYAPVTITPEDSPMWKALREQQKRRNWPWPAAPGVVTGWTNQPLKPRVEVEIHVKCDCGAAHTREPHAHWCSTRKHEA